MHRLRLTETVYSLIPSCQRRVFLFSVVVICRAFASKQHGGEYHEGKSWLIY